MKNKTYKDIKTRIHKTIRIIDILYLEDLLKTQGVGIHQGVALYFLANHVSKSIRKPIVEIGSYKGGSTIYLAKGIKHSKQKNLVYAIDSFDGGDSPEYDITNPENLIEHFPKTGATYEVFTNNICRAKIKEFVKPIKKKSQDAIKHFNKKISLLFIDGCHEYQSVKQDFLLWSPLIVKGGFIAFHDYHSLFPGVIKVIDEIVKKSDCFKLFDQIGNLIIFIKTK